MFDGCRWLRLRGREACRDGFCRWRGSGWSIPLAEHVGVLASILIVLIAMPSCSGPEQPAEPAAVEVESAPEHVNPSVDETVQQEPVQREAGGEVSANGEAANRPETGQKNDPAQRSSSTKEPAELNSDPGQAASAASEDPRPRAAVFEWLEQMGSEAAVERRAASEAIDELGQAGLPFVVAGLREGTPARKRGAAVYLIGRVSPRNHEAAAALTEALDADDEELRHAALQAVEKLSDPQLVSALPSLLSLAESSDESAAYRSRAIRAITKLGPAAESATNRLIEVARDEQTPLKVRQACFFGLVKIAPNDIAEKFFRRELKKNAVPELRRLAAQWLADVASSNEALNGLIAGLNDPVKAVRLEAVDGLVEIGKPSVSPLIEALESSDVQTRRYATLAIGKLGRLAAEAAPAIESRLNDPDEQVRELAEVILNRLGAGREKKP